MDFGANVAFEPLNWSKYFVKFVNKYTVPPFTDYNWYVSLVPRSVIWVESEGGMGRRGGTC